MPRFIVALSATASLFAGSAWSATAILQVVGSHANAENGCTGVTPALSGRDCSYNASNPSGFPTTSWTGPAFFAGYYDSSIGTGPSLPGDGKINPDVTGSITIDDQNTADASDDFIELSLTVGAVAARFFPVVNGIDFGEESWQTMDIELGSTSVTTVTANAFGGITYAIGNFPELLVGPSGETFPSESAPLETAGTAFWSGPGDSGVATFEGAGSGATASMTFNGYSCTDVGGAGACTSDWALANQGDIDNFLLLVSTDVSGAIVSGNAIWVQEFGIVGAQPDSYTASLITFASVVPLPAGVWLFLSALGVLGGMRQSRLSLK